MTDVRRRKNQQEAYALRQTGKTFSQIGMELGFSGSYARQLVGREERKLYYETVKPNWVEEMFSTPEDREAIADFVRRA